MFISGLFIAAAISLASFFSIIFLTTPQTGLFVVIPFYLTFFFALTSVAALCGVLFEYLWSVWGRSKRASDRITNGFCRGVLLGGFATALLLAQTWGMLTLEMGIVIFIPFALIEAYTIGHSL